jgi:iron-sulfur cluster repair protein YtfE (RIC family)
MTATERLHAEHADLLPRIEALRATAESADVLDAAALVTEVDEALAFLRGHLVPHARAEDEVLYPEVERVLGAPRATATMRRDHVEVLRLVDELASLRDVIAARGAGRSDVQEVERLLYGLYAVLHLHFAKEEEVYLPLLDETLTREAADALMERMREAAHAPAGVS